MSDICDDADGVRRLTEGGARFGGSFRKSACIRQERKACSRCMTQPIRRSEGDKEYLACPTCGRRTESLRSRQTLQVQWNGMN